MYVYAHTHIPKHTNNLLNPYVTCMCMISGLITEVG